MICRAESAPRRNAAWELINGAIPEGMRVSQTCNVAYCGKIEHMILARNKNSGQQNYTQYRERIETLKDGEYFEIAEVSNNKQALIKFRSGLQAVAGLHKIFVRSLPNGGVRVYKAGGWAAWFSGQEGWRAKHHPLLLNKRCSEVRPACLYLGFLFVNLFERANVVPQERCEVKACVRPALDNRHVCHHHLHFFAYKESLTDRTIDPKAFWSAREPHATFEYVNDIRPPARRIP